MLEIDGSHGEGGGQLVRLAAALSVISAIPIRVSRVRAGREKPGLAAQHLAALHALAALSGARAEGLELKSQEFSLVPGAPGGERQRCDVGTAGSVTLVLQALLPVMLARGTACAVTVTGGTDVRAAPPLDYFGAVLLPLLERMQARVNFSVRRRGYFPHGGGEVEIAVQPGALRPFLAQQQGALGALAGVAHVANLPEQIAARMRAAALERLGERLRGVAGIRSAVLGADAASGQGGAIVVWACTRHTVLGAGRVAERGVRAESLGEAVGEELAADLASGATLDVHAADQMLVYLALARGGAFTVRRVTRHAETAMWLIEQFLPVRFATSVVGPLTRVEVLADQSGR